MDQSKTGSDNLTNKILSPTRVQGDPKIKGAEAGMEVQAVPVSRPIYVSLLRGVLREALFFYSF